MSNGGSSWPAAIAGTPRSSEPIRMIVRACTGGAQHIMAFPSDFKTDRGGPFVRWNRPGGSHERQFSDDQRNPGGGGAGRDRQRAGRGGTPAGRSANHHERAAKGRAPPAYADGADHPAA